MTQPNLEVFDLIKRPLETPAKKLRWKYAPGI